MLRFSILLDQEKFIENLLVQGTMHIGQVCSRHRKACGGGIGARGYYHSVPLLHWESTCTGTRPYYY